MHLDTFRTRTCIVLRWQWHLELDAVEGVPKLQEQ
jgi:hypothetical protein